MTTDFSTSQAAQKLNVSERTIRNWIEDRTINAYKLNPENKSVYRIPQTEVERILRQRIGTKKQPRKIQTN
jgi:excisionase family DNA binding protein